MKEGFEAELNANMLELDKSLELNQSLSVQEMGRPKVTEHLFGPVCLAMNELAVNPSCFLNSTIKASVPRGSGIKTRIIRTETGLVEGLRSYLTKLNNKYEFNSFSEEDNGLRFFDGEKRSFDLWQTPFGTAVVVHDRKAAKNSIKEMKRLSRNKNFVKALDEIKKSVDSGLYLTAEQATELPKKIKHYFLKDVEAGLWDFVHDFGLAAYETGIGLEEKKRWFGLRKEKVVDEKDRKRTEELLKGLVNYAGLFGFTGATLKAGMEDFGRKLEKYGYKKDAEKIEALRKYAEEKGALPSGKIASARSLKSLGIAGILASSLLAVGLYVNNENQRKEKRIQQLVSAGLSPDEAKLFDGKYNSWAVEDVYNQSSVNFAKLWKDYRILAEHDLNASRSLEKMATLNLFNINSTLLGEIYRNSQDTRADMDSNALAEETSDLCLPFAGEIQRLSQIYMLTNGTAYFRTAENLRNEIGDETLLAAVRKLGENDGINKDFNNKRKHANLLRLAKYVPNILKYPKDWKEGAIQVDDMIYVLCGVSSEKEKEAWTRVVRPAVQYIVDKLDNGEAKYELNIPDKFLEAQERRQRLLPAIYFGIELDTGKTSRSPLLVAEHNLNPVQALGGKSPQEWLDEMAKKDFSEKTLRYQLTIEDAYEGHPAYGEWSNSNEAYQRLFGNVERKDHIVVSFDGLMKEDEVAVFIQGYPRAISRGFMPWDLEPVVNMSGQITPNYCQAVARVFGRAAFVVTDKYPNSDGYHDEAYVIISPQLYEKLTQYGKLTFPYMFGWWEYAEPLKQDHAEGKYPIDLSIIRASAKEFEKANP